MRGTALFHFSRDDPYGHRPRQPPDDMGAGREPDGDGEQARHRPLEVRQGGSGQLRLPFRGGKRARGWRSDVRPYSRARRRHLRIRRHGIGQQTALRHLPGVHSCALHRPAHPVHGKSRRGIVTDPVHARRFPCVRREAARADTLQVNSSHAPIFLCFQGRGRLEEEQPHAGPRQGTLIPPSVRKVSGVGEKREVRHFALRAPSDAIQGGQAVHPHLPR